MDGRGRVARNVLDPPTTCHGRNALLTSIMHLQNTDGRRATPPNVDCSREIRKIDEFYLSVVLVEAGERLWELHEIESIRGVKWFPYERK